MQKHLSILMMIILLIVSCKNGKKDDQSGEYHVNDTAILMVDSVYYQIDMQYPVFSISNSKTNVTADKLNQTLKAFTDTAAVYFWGVEPEGAKTIKDETGAHGKFELMNRYELLYNTCDLISLKMETYSFALGAHGFTAITTYNFSPNQDAFLSITDFLILSLPENVSKLNALLVKHFENPNNCFNQDPDIEANNEKIAFDGDNLIFYFEAYELGPYACGSATIRIPVKELKSNGLWRLEMN